MISYHRLFSKIAERGFEAEDMTDQIEELREKVLAVLRRNDVKRAAFFGSIVRGEMTKESDVEILVEFEGR